ESLTRTIQERGLERVRVIAIDELASLPTETAIAGTVPLLSKVRITAGYEPVARWKLGGSYLCASVEEIYRLRQVHPEVTFLTSGNQTIRHGDRSLSSGSTPTKVGV